MSKTRIYRAWQMMHDRCKNNDSRCFERYGGRGITVDERWNKFETFYADMGDRPVGKTLDRIDNNGPYSKENCRWADVETQVNNRRNNVWVEIEGTKFTVAQAAKHFGIKQSKLRERLKRGWALEKAIVDGGQK